MALVKQCKTDLVLRILVFCIRDERVSLVDLKPIGKIKPDS